MNKSMTTTMNPNGVDIPPEHNQAQLYILINALENLRISADEQEYEFIRNNLLSRFRDQMKEHKAKYDNNE